MSESFEARIDRLAATHSERGILLDTNVLLLLVAAQLNPAMIGKNRLAAYTREDALLLQGYASRFARILTTAHVLAETSNLASGMLYGRSRDHLFANLFRLFCVDDAGSLCQVETRGRSVELKLFVPLGLTDACLASVAGDKHLLLTDDLELYVAVVSRGAEALNFTHMREASGTLP